MNLEIMVRGVTSVALKDIKVYYKKAPVFIFGLILPTFLFFAFFMGRQLDLGTYYPGFLAMALFFTASSVGPLITPWEKQAGTFERLLTLPVSIPVLVMGDTLAGAGFGMMISVIVFGAGLFIAPFEIGLLGLLALPLLFALGNLCFSALGVLISSPAGPVPSNIMMLSSLIRFPLIFISGIFVPLADMEGAFRIVTLASPLTYLVDGFNHALMDQGVLSLAADLLVLLVFTAAFLLAANYILKRKAMKGL
ncbi:MAG: ABC-2 type transporter [Methanomassiliicoccales archaeon PtaB.Bin215]|nr:MAG: ABC-2 type transporter [Methanomassiliicoccales archaeon PtaB.Bin215]